MGRKGRFLIVVAGLVLAAVSATAAFGAHSSDPGITKTSIHIGGTFPLTGVSARQNAPACQRRLVYAPGGG